MVGTLAVESDSPSACGFARDAECGSDAAARCRHREYATPAGNHRKPYIGDAVTHRGRRPIMPQIGSRYLAVTTAESEAASRPEWYNIGTGSEEVHMFEFDLISKLLGSFLAPLLARGAGDLGQRVFKGKGPARDGGTAEQRFDAYERLRRGCVELRTVLDVLWSLQTLRLSGALISVPIYLRLLHRITPLGAAVNDAFLAVALVGTRDVVESADELAEALQAVVKRRQADHFRRIQKTPGRADWSEFDTALGRFVETSRADLGIQPLTKEGMSVTPAT